jgi:hypothetical protein
MRRTRMIVSAVTLMMAVYLIVTPFALSLFSRARDAQHLKDYYQPVMSTRGVQEFRANLQLVNAGGNELYNAFLPQIQHDLGLDATQLTAFVGQNYPAVAAFLTRAPQVVKYLNPATQKVLAQQHNFHDAAEFPLTGIPVTAGPWALLGLGLGLAVIGVVILRTERRLPLVVVTLVGLALVVGPAALGWFHETDAAEHVAEAARGPFSVAVSNATVDDTYKFNAAFTEMRQAMFPAIGRQLGKTPAQTDAFLHTTFPAMMRFLDAWDQYIYRGAHVLSLSQIRFMDEFHNVDATPYTALPWIFMAPGVVLLVVGAYGLFASRRSASDSPG